MDSSKPDPEMVAQTREAIAEAVKNTEPIKLTRPPLAEGDLGSIFRKAARQNKRELHALQAKENYKFCRKKCPFFKCKNCFQKSFQEQKECAESKKYLEFENQECSQT